MLKIPRVRKWEQEGVIAPEQSDLAARGFFLKDLLCFQGRDASDQHIEDVVLKMLQGEGAPTPPPHLHVALWESHELCLQGVGDLTYVLTHSGPLMSAEQPEEGGG